VHPDNVPGRFAVDDTCITCGLCHDLAPTVFDYGDTQLVVVRQPTPETLPDVLEAVAACPVEAIHDRADAPQQNLSRTPAEVAPAPPHGGRYR
jgi:ferredoxin